MNKDLLIKKLIEFRSKACTIYTQQRAIHIWNQVKSHLTEKQARDIQDAWHHLSLGRNMKEPFHLTVNEIIDEIKNN